MIKKTAVLLAFTTIFSHAAFAGDMGVIEEGWKRVLTLSGGPSWSQNGETQTFFLQPDIQKTYDNQSSNSTLGSGEVFLGLQHSFNANFLWQIGLALAASSDAKLTGDIWEDADPDFNNYFYRYYVNHQHIAAKGKVLATGIKLVQPYVSGSIGVGFNHSHNFVITPQIFEEVPAPPFNGYTKTAFTYTVGAGIQRAITSSLYASVGYEFADWGKSNLAAADGQTMNSGLSLNHLYTNQLQFGLTLVA